MTSLKRRTRSHVNLVRLWKSSPRTGNSSGQFRIAPPCLWTVTSAIIATSKYSDVEDKCKIIYNSETAVCTRSTICLPIEKYYYYFLWHVIPTTIFGRMSGTNGLMSAKWLLPETISRYLITATHWSNGNFFAETKWWSRVSNADTSSSGKFSGKYLHIYTGRG